MACLQWGCGATGQTITLPVAFDNAGVCAVIGHRYYNNNLFQIEVGKTYVSTYGGPATQTSFYYLALGY